MSAILCVHLYIRPAVFIAPPVFTNRCEKRSNLLSHMLMNLIHMILNFRLILLRPAFINHRRAPGFTDHVIQRHCRIKEVLFRPKGMGMLLENDMKNKTAQPVFASVGKWEKAGDDYRCSIIGLGDCGISFWAESIMLSPDQTPGISMKLRYIRPFDPYSDYSIAK